MVSFFVFRKYMYSLEHRNKRMELRRLSLRADMLKDRCQGIGIDFKYLLQADFVLFMRTEVDSDTNFTRWWPETLLWLSHYHSPFEIFARAVSRQYFDKIKCLLGINAPSDLDTLLSSYKDGSRRLPRWEFEGFSPFALLGYEQLAKRP